MLVEFCSPSPKQGTREHVSREVATALIVAGFAKEIVAPPATFQVAPVPIEFGIFRGALATTPTTLYCRCNQAPCNGRTEHYIGAPDAESIAKNFSARLCIHAKSLAVPEDVQAAYAQLHIPSPNGWRSGVPGINAPSGSTPGEQRYGIDMATGKILK
jgi:hypothetical protein